MSGDYLLYLGLLMVGVAVFNFVHALFSNSNPSASLQWASQDAPAKSQSKLIEASRPIMHQFTLQYASKVKSVDYRKRVETAILTAGMNNELNVDEFIGLQFLWAIFLPVVMALTNFLLGLDISYMIFVLMVPVGGFLPFYQCAALKKIRYQKVIVHLPFFIDLLALSTEAGLDFIGGLQKIVDKAPNSILAQEFENVLRDIKLGSTREKALRDMAKRLDMGEVSSFVNVLTDADSTGASIGTVLKEQSIQMRLERFTRAEKAGAVASQTIIIPIILFIVPAVLIAILGPIGLQFFYGGQ